MENVAKFVTDITVIDPDTGDDIELCVYKDENSGAMFAIDASYDLGTIPSPFNAEPLELLEPEE
ncbi:hypothetical protein [Idiomarina abyssalis]|uniref:Uncharacterized protein n=1 Tax=Idiomarina abyssalis TaxID=86102 RepID=A0A8I1GD89_9GAMM|nr:hypothetical protein [Idiomarina abyssalis]MBJ7265519.1 hypothetical protein [Idiomarina abyssalis]MBJ7316807.1 hypothetical protein [Idiomarina abyssalis]